MDKTDRKSWRQGIQEGQFCTSELEGMVTGIMHSPVHMATRMGLQISNPYGDSKKEAVSPLKG